MASAKPDKRPQGKEVKQPDAQAVSDGEHNRYRDTVPAGRNHQVERHVAARVEIALRARGEEVLPEPTSEQLERKIVVVVEEMPVDVLACVDSRRRADCGGRATNRSARRASLRPPAPAAA